MTVTAIRHYDYWFDLPPEPSPKMAKWVRKVRAGWRPNSRILSMGRDACSEFYDIYQAEWYALMLLSEGPEWHAAVYFAGEHTEQWAAWLERHFPE